MVTFRFIGAGVVGVRAFAVVALCLLGSTESLAYSPKCTFNYAKPMQGAEVPTWLKRLLAVARLNIQRDGLFDTTFRENFIIDLERLEWVEELPVATLVAPIWGATPIQGAFPESMRKTLRILAGGNVNDVAFEPVEVSFTRFKVNSTTDYERVREEGDTAQAILVPIQPIMLEAAMNGNIPAKNHIRNLLMYNLSGSNPYLVGIVRETMGDGRETVSLAFELTRGRPETVDGADAFPRWDGVPEAVRPGGERETVGAGVGSNESDNFGYSF